MNISNPDKSKMHLRARLALTLVFVILGFTTTIRAASAQQMMVDVAAYENPKAWFDPASCGGTSRGHLYVQVGKSLLKIPLDVIRGIQPGKFQIVRDAKGKMAYRLHPKSGCREVPLSISAANISAQPGKHDPIIISVSPDSRTIETQLSTLRTRGSCPKVAPGLIGCSGTRKVGKNPHEESILYLMAADAALVQVAGGPLRALCRMPQGKAVCTVIDDLPGGVRFETLLTSAPTLSSITQAHKSSRLYVDSLRVTAR